MYKLNFVHSFLQSSSKLGENGLENGTPDMKNLCGFWGGDISKYWGSSFPIFSYGSRSVGFGRGGVLVDAVITSSSNICIDMLNTRPRAVSFFAQLIRRQGGVSP